MKQFSIGGHLIGAIPCFVIAEAGVNHNGSEDLAASLIDAASQSGADAIKFQTFQADALVAPTAEQADYQVRNTGIRESQASMLSRLSLSADAFERLWHHARRRGIVMMSTPFDEGSADFLEDLGVPAFKIPSGEITNHPFLAHIAQKGRPVIMSTGMSTLAEVAAAVGVVRAAGDPPLALLHCVTNYPAESSECNLRAIDTLAQHFDVPIGWSDHTDGVAIPLAAVARGASIIEKHLTLDRSLPGPDHASSALPDEFRTMVTLIRSVQSALGTGEKSATASELSIAFAVRRSLHVRSSIQAGHRLTAQDLISLRPAGGIPPSQLGLVVGRVVRQHLLSGHMLTERDLQ